MHHDAETSYNQFIYCYVRLYVHVMVHYNTMILPDSKSNKEDITVTYIINGRGSVIRLTDCNLSVYLDFFKLYCTRQHFTMILSGYRPYITSRSFCYKTYTSLL